MKPKPKEKPQPLVAEFMLTATQRKAMRAIYDRDRDMPMFGVIGFIVRVDEDGDLSMNGRERARFALVKPEGFMKLRAFIKERVVQ